MPAKTAFSPSGGVWLQEPAAFPENAIHEVDDEARTTRR